MYRNSNREIININSWDEINIRPHGEENLFDDHNLKQHAITLIRKYSDNSIAEIYLHGMKYYLKYQRCTLIRDYENNTRYYELVDMKGKKLHVDLYEDSKYINLGNDPTKNFILRCGIHYNNILIDNWNKNKIVLIISDTLEEIEIPLVYSYYFDGSNLLLYFTREDYDFISVRINKLDKNTLKMNYHINIEIITKFRNKYLIRFRTTKDLYVIDEDTFNECYIKDKWVKNILEINQ